MSRVTPEMRNFAARLTAHETSKPKSSETETPAAFQTFERLRPHLAELVGTSGYRSLLSRALALSNDEVRWLRAVHVKADGSLEKMGDLQARLDPKEFIEGAEVLLAQLLGLLATFIGEILTLRLVRDIWPEVPLKDSDFDEGGSLEGTHEKTK